MRLPKFACVSLAACAVALAACSTAPPPTDPDALAEYRRNNDPYESTNRFTYRVNTAVDEAVLRPVAVGYTYIFPAPVRGGIHNFLTNLSSPVTLADDMLQGKPRRAGDTLMRALINTTVGVAGIFDVATDWGYPHHDTDFGVTLAVWGLDSGPYLFLPLFGPSSPRDAGGIAGDVALDPLTWVGKGPSVTALDAARFAVTAIDARAAHIDDIDQIKRTALDPYATFRSLYQQNRAAQIQTTRDDDRRTVPAWFPDRAGQTVNHGAIVPDAPSTTVTPAPAQSTAPNQSAKP